jgi:hypothetical protein
MIGLPIYSEPFRVLPNSECIIARFFWDDNPENEPLSEGKYYSFLKDDLLINNIIVKIDLEVEFEVK